MRVDNSLRSDLVPQTWACPRSSRKLRSRRRCSRHTPRTDSAFSDHSASPTRQHPARNCGVASSPYYSVE